MTPLYKWQYKEYAPLSNLLNCPSQALLISARPGMGHDILIQNYVALLMCDRPNAKDNSFYTCNECPSCVLFIGSNHPDFYQLTVNIDGDKKNVSIEDIRYMLEFVATTTHLGRYKVVLIPDVDLLSINSANALLKILEEPPSYVRFILQTTNISGVLATIKSRCYIYRLPGVNTQDAFTYVKESGIYNPGFWFAYYENAPLFDLEVTKEQFDVLIKAFLQPSIENIFIASGKFEAKNAGFLIGFFSKWLNDLASYLQGAPMRYFMEYNAEIEKLAKRIDLQKVFYLFDKVNFLQDWTLHPLNYKLQLENLLLQYQSLFIKR
ncbi:MAG: hypothetical protein K0R94_1178 [Burkholderiales bacterium]|jgi:DNA polymerase-3 subunit delta'|nr:hypothetical protein [Burkholderiales bacterium]